MVQIDILNIDLGHNTALLSLRGILSEAKLSLAKSKETKQSRPDVPKPNGIAAPEGSR